MVTYTTKVLIPTKPVLRRVLAFYRLPVLELSTLLNRVTIQGLQENQ